MIQDDNLKFGFKTTLVGLTAFIADFEKHLHDILGNKKVPVYFLDTGDETYYDSRFDKIGDKNEIYKHTPRCVFKIDTIETDNGSESTKNINIKYVHNNKIYWADVSKYANEVPLQCNFISPNFILGQQYFEILMTIFHRYNGFTYNYMKNTYEGQYSCKSYNFEFPTGVASSENKFFTINFTVKLNLPIYIPNYSTIKQLNPKNGYPIDIVGNAIFEYYIGIEGFLREGDIDGDIVHLIKLINVDDSGYLIDVDGNTFLDVDGNPIKLTPIGINSNGDLINSKSGKRITNDNNELIDGLGNIILDENGQPIIIPSIFIDTDNTLIDINGDTISNGNENKKDEPIKLIDINNFFDINNYSPFRLRLQTNHTKDEWCQYITDINYNPKEDV